MGTNSELLPANCVTRGSHVFSQGIDDQSCNKRTSGTALFHLILKRI